MVKQTVANVPQVHGKESGLMEQFMEEEVGVGSGDKRSCARLYTYQVCLAWGPMRAGKTERVQ